MALTAFQSSVLRLLADNRRNNAESYVAGGLALNYKLGTPRVRVTLPEGWRSTTSWERLAFRVTSTYSMIPKRLCSEAGKATALRLRQMALP